MIPSRAVANYFFKIKSSNGILVSAIFPLGKMLLLRDFLQLYFQSRARALIALSER